MTKTNNEKIFIQIGEEVIELTGQAKEDFIADREATLAAKQLVEAENKSKKEAAEAKLALLGLTTDDLKALGI